MEIARYAEKVSGVSDLELLDRHGKEVVEKTFNTDTELLDELVCHLKCPGDFETAALLTDPLPAQVPHDTLAEHNILRIHNSPPRSRPEVPCNSPHP